MTTSGHRPARPTPRQSLQPVVWITLILLAAAAFRLVDLPAVPPGMTHDEADHGITAWSIVNGARDIYFTIGYGREPLYDYATAVVMAATGPTIFAARLTSVYFSLLLAAGSYAWTRLAFDRATALLTAAGLAVGFWPVMVGRQALRSIALPALFVLALLFFWRGLVSLADDRPQNRRGLLVVFGVAGLLLGLTFYTYIPARVLWLVFPAVVVYPAFAAPHVRSVRRRLDGLILTLIVAAFTAAPLFFYLANNPGLEVRIEELSAPLRSAAAGDFGPLWANAAGSLQLFTFTGDTAWRYNLPGKPWLEPLTGVLFYGGLALAAWYAIRGLMTRDDAAPDPLRTGNYAPGAFAAVVWLVLGLAPVLVTGPELSTTQAIGILPVLYLFPALALVAIYGAVSARISALARRKTLAAGAIAAAVLLYGIIGLMTARDYFVRWASAPEVRVQYESTLLATLRYLEARGAEAAVSTITPGRFHSPAVAAMTLRQASLQPRWFDGRGSLLLPNDAEALVTVPGFTPVPDALRPYLATAEVIDELPLRTDDLDRPVTVYRIDGSAAADAALARLATQTEDAALPASFGGHLSLLGYDLSSPSARPGETITLVTAWRLEQALPDAVLFAHLGAGEPAAQADRLDAPGEFWRSGDYLLQLHEIAIPPDLPPGDYPLSVGVYTPQGGRLAVEATDADAVRLTTVRIADE